MSWLYTVVLLKCSSFRFDISCRFKRRKQLRKHCPLGHNLTVSYFVPISAHSLSFIIFFFYLCLQLLLKPLWRSPKRRRAATQRPQHTASRTKAPSPRAHLPFHLRRRNRNNNNSNRKWAGPQQQVRKRSNRRMRRCHKRVRANKSITTTYHRYFPHCSVWLLREILLRLPSLSRDSLACLLIQNLTNIWNPGINNNKNKPNQQARLWTARNPVVFLWRLHHLNKSIRRLQIVRIRSWNL